MDRMNFGRLIVVLIALAAWPMRAAVVMAAQEQQQQQQQQRNEQHLPGIFSRRAGGGLTGGDSGVGYTAICAGDGARKRVV